MAVPETGWISVFRELTSTAENWKFKKVSLQRSQEASSAFRGSCGQQQCQEPKAQENKIIKIKFTEAGKQSLCSQTQLGTISDDKRQISGWTRQKHPIVTTIDSWLPMATHGHLYSYSISIVRTSLKQRLEMIMSHV